MDKFNSLRISLTYLPGVDGPTPTSNDPEWEHVSSPSSASSERVQPNLKPLQLSPSSSKLLHSSRPEPTPSPGPDRPHPQYSFLTTTINPSSFLGTLRTLYAEKVLKTQLEQMKKQGSYRAFDGKWQDIYDVNRLHEGKCSIRGSPPSLFWESDVGKWIEATTYFLASTQSESSLTGNPTTSLVFPTLSKEFEESIDYLIDLMEKAQKPDGYLNIYFTVVDPKGRMMNLRDYHEMYNMGHLLEAALAHHRHTGSRRFLDIMIRCVDCWSTTFGPAPHQLHGYPGHPQAELAILRLASLTKDPSHIAFGKYLLEARGVKREDQGGEGYYPWEARVRRGGDLVHNQNLEGLADEDMTYNSSHVPLHDMKEIVGHAVRAWYLVCAAADQGGLFLVDALRLWKDAVEKKMYVTGGFGSVPRLEAFSEIPYFLPQSTPEGGCYAETCAAVGCMMTSERILSHGLNEMSGLVRDTLERCLYNAVLGGGSLNGKKFSYANKHATSDGEESVRSDWFQVCCCPPNLARTLGMVGGYLWSDSINQRSKTISLTIYIYASAIKTIELPGGQIATVTMQSGMPWKGETSIEVDLPREWKIEVKLPVPEYAEDIKFSEKVSTVVPGFVGITLSNTSKLNINFNLRIRLLAPHPSTNQDTLTVTRGPIVFVAEDIDNDLIESSYPHFQDIGLSVNAEFEAKETDILGIPSLMLRTTGESDVFGLHTESQSKGQPLYRSIKKGTPARRWEALKQGLTFIPWFARANRGGREHLRVSMLRVGGEEAVVSAKSQDDGAWVQAERK